MDGVKIRSRNTIEGNTPASNLICAGTVPHPRGRQLDFPWSVFLQCRRLLFGGHVMKNRNTFNQTPFLTEIEAAETKPELTMAIVRFRLALEEHYGLEPETT